MAGSKLYLRAIYDPHCIVKSKACDQQSNTKVKTTLD